MQESEQHKKELEEHNLLHLKSDAEVARLRALVDSQKKIIVSLNKSLDTGLRGGEFYAF